MIFAIVAVVVAVAFGYAAYKHVSLKSEFAQFKAYVTAELAKLKGATATDVTAVVDDVNKV
jgi:hypothetical protein